MKIQLIFFISLFCFVCSDALLNKAEDCKCKLMPQKRIVNGRIAHPQSYPWTASLSYNSLKFKDRAIKRLLPNHVKTSGLMCSATLINRKWLLTAAICITSNLKHLTIGIGNDNDLVKQFEDDHLPIKRVIKHEWYNNTSGSIFNLALIELEKEINFSDSISPGCLKISMNDSSEQPNANHSIVQTAGWGSMDNTISAIDALQSRYLKEMELVDKSESISACKKNEELMCARSLNRSEFLTLNDLGSSISYMDKGRSYIVAILSHLDIGVDDEKKRSFLTGQSIGIRLSKSIEWIKKYVNDDFCSDLS